MDSTAPSDTELTDYEKNQQFNAITRWLHSFRYRNIVEVFGELAREIPSRPIRVLEIGAATGRLYEVLAERFSIDYTGIEIDPTFCAAAMARHGHRANFKLLQRSATEAGVFAEVGRPDLVIALETFEHMPERDSFPIIERVAALAPRRFVCSVPVEVGPAIWIKNVGSRLMGYDRKIAGGTWSRTFWAGLYRLDHLPPHSTEHLGFDWRWLAHTVRHFMEIREIRKNPFPWVPRAFAFSVMMIAVPRRNDVPG